MATGPAARSAASNTTSREVWVAATYSTVSTQPSSSPRPSGRAANTGSQKLLPGSGVV
mgnify:CR=1 FL=1